MESDTPPLAIGASPGGFVHSFLKRRRNPSLSALPQPLAPLASSQHIPSAAPRIQDNSLQDQALPATSPSSRRPPFLYVPLKVDALGTIRSNDKALVGQVEPPKFLETLDETVPFAPRDLDQ